MDSVISNVIHEFELKAKKLKENLSVGTLGKLQVIVLGQQGLLIRKNSLPHLSLVATNDFDGLLKGQPPLDSIFKRCLNEQGLSYDEQSKYIWLPDETEYEIIYESDTIIVSSPLPIFLILSKAKFAPSKNKQLIIAAINVYGDQLLSLMTKHQVDIEQFLKGSL